MRPFKSIYKDGYVTVDNYIAELFFQRRAEFNKSALPQQFWNNPKYKQQYVIQLIHINKLLECVSSSAIIKAFKATKACSILNKELVAKAIVFQEEMDKVQKEITQKEVVSEKPSAPFGERSRLTEL